MKPTFSMKLINFDLKLFPSKREGESKEPQKNKIINANANPRLTRAFCLLIGGKMSELLMIKLFSLLGRQLEERLCAFLWILLNL